MFLPVQPVPRGTGVSWASANGLLDAGSDESVVLSVFVTADGIWLGLSRVNEFQKIEGDDIAKLEAALKEHKQSAFFADRTDIEIAGDGPVTYERFVKVLDAVAKQGFTSWEITDPLSLSARPQL